MPALDGEWAIVTNTPMGPQESVLTIRTDGNSFTGSNIGPLGGVDIHDGKIDGETLTWTMELTAPFPMTLSGRATVNGDSIQGAIDAGAMGLMPLSGTRKV